jgi:hypothetical protein
MKYHWIQTYFIEKWFKLNKILVDFKNNETYVNSQIEWWIFFKIKNITFCQYSILLIHFITKLIFITLLPFLNQSLIHLGLKSIRKKYFSIYWYHIPYIRTNQMKLFKKFPKPNFNWYIESYLCPKFSRNNFSINEKFR